MKKYIYIGLFLFFNCYAQNPEWINLTNGDKVFDIISSGNYLWIGTDGGLVSLDKTTDKLTFFNRGNANLPDNHIRTLAMDSSGFLWIGTQYEGIGKFDGSNCQVFNTSNSQLPANQWNMEIEAGPEGNIWIGSFKYVCRLSGNDWKIYETGDPLSPYYSINDIIFDKNGTQWIAASWGLARLVNDSLLIEINGGFHYGEVNVILADEENRIWAGTALKGLYMYNGSEWSVYDSLNSDIPSNTIHDMEFDKNGNLWMATGKGLVKFNGSEWQVYNSSNSGLAEDAVLSIEIDENGIIWLGFFRHGLMKYDGTNWKKYNLSNSILPTNGVYAVETDTKGNVWIGNSGTISLIKFDGNNWLLYDTTNSGLKKTISALESDIAGNIWMGYFPNPLLIKNNYWLAKFESINWVSYDSTNSPFSLTSVFCLKTDTNDDLWIGCSKGLLKFDGTEWFIYNKDNTPLPNNLIMDIAFDDNGNLWCGIGYYIVYDDSTGEPSEIPGGLAKFDGINWQIYNSTNSGLPYDNITSVVVDENNIVWAAIRHPNIVGIEYGWGMTKFDGSGWTNYNINNSPLTSNTIFDITTDNDNNLWLSTCAGGLVRYDRNDNWTIYNVRNSGLAFDSQNLVSVDTYGNKWIGHNESGLSVFREGGVILTDVHFSHRDPQPESFILYQNYPNPFNPVTIISFYLPENSNISLVLYDILGAEVKSITTGNFDKGRHEVILNSAGLPSGIYFCRMQAKNFSSARKLVLVK
ncbi:MAG: two-component regulator propeller domain-containing protein [Ignavibacteriaceae bacterium]